ncbi:hypothetical protein Bhyg_04463, partial [Pseudolycoriella hygida]
ESRRVAKKLRTSIMRLQLQAENMEKPIKDSKVRWNSQYNMLFRLVELKPFCLKYQNVTPELHLTESLWGDIDKLLEALKPKAHGGVDRRGFFKLVYLYEKLIRARYSLILSVKLRDIPPSFIFTSLAVITFIASVSYYFETLYSKEMSHGPFNSTAFTEDYLLQDTDLGKSVEDIEVDEEIEEGVELSEQEITEISNIAAQLDIENTNGIRSLKRNRGNNESSANNSIVAPAAKKVRKVVMAQPEAPVASAQPIIPLVNKDRWKDPKIKSLDQGEQPKMVRATITFAGPVPEILDFFEDIDLKNDSIDTNEWRVYGRKKLRGNKTNIFIGVDEKSAQNLKAIGFKPYFANGRTKINLD